MNYSNLFGLIGILTMTQFSYADHGRPFDRVLSERPGISGNGCPDGAFSVAVSPDGSAVTILFDRFEVQAGKPSGKTVDRLVCVVRLPIDLPEGMMLESMTTDLRGFNSLPPQATSRITGAYQFYSDQEHGRVHRPKRFEFGSSLASQDFKGENGEFIFTLSGGPGVDHHCMRSSVQYVDLYVSLSVSSNGASETSLVQLDSADLTRDASLVIQAKTGACNSNGWGHGNRFR